MQLIIMVRPWKSDDESGGKEVVIERAVIFVRAEAKTEVAYYGLTTSYDKSSGKEVVVERAVVFVGIQAKTEVAYYVRMVSPSLMSDESTCSGTEAAQY